MNHKYDLSIGMFTKSDLRVASPEEIREALRNGKLHKYTEGKAEVTFVEYNDHIYVLEMKGVTSESERRSVDERADKSTSPQDEPLG